MPTFSFSAILHNRLLSFLGFSSVDVHIGNSMFLFFCCVPPVLHWKWYQIVDRILPVHLQIHALLWWTLVSNLTMPLKTGYTLQTLASLNSKNSSRMIGKFLHLQIHCIVVRYLKKILMGTEHKYGILAKLGCTANTLNSRICTGTIKFYFLVNSLLLEFFKCRVHEFLLASSSSSCR